MKDNLVMFIQGRRAALAHIPRDTSSEEWGRLQIAFAESCSSRRTEADFVFCVSLSQDQVFEGVYYSWDLAGPDGATFEIYRMPHHSDADVNKCRSHIKKNRDVVRMSVCTISEWLPLGKAGLGECQLDPDEVFELK